VRKLPLRIKHCLALTRWHRTADAFAKKNFVSAVNFDFALS
jgi:hypothetical protein